MSFQLKQKVDLALEYSFWFNDEIWYIHLISCLAHLFVYYIDFMFCLKGQPKYCLACCLQLLHCIVTAF